LPKGSSVCVALPDDVTDTASVVLLLRVSLRGRYAQETLVCLGGTQSERAHVTRTHTHTHTHTCRNLIHFTKVNKSQQGIFAQQLTFGVSVRCMFLPHLNFSSLMHILPRREYWMRRGGGCVWPSHCRVHINKLHLLRGSCVICQEP